MTTALEKINFERTYKNEETTLEAKYTAKNRFDLLGFIQSLERLGYTVTPYKYHTNSQGYLTKEVWLYRGYLNNRVVWIYA